MADRWLTFDCFGTLIDWRHGIRTTGELLWLYFRPLRASAAWLADGRLSHTRPPKPQKGPRTLQRKISHRGFTGVRRIAVIVCMDRARSVHMSGLRISCFARYPASAQPWKGTWWPSSSLPQNAPT